MSTKDRRRHRVARWPFAAAPALLSLAIAGLCAISNRVAVPLLFVGAVVAFLVSLLADEDLTRPYLRRLPKAVAAAATIACLLVANQGDRGRLRWVGYVLDAPHVEGATIDDALRHASAEALTVSVRDAVVRRDYAVRASVAHHPEVAACTAAPLVSAGWTPTAPVRAWVLCADDAWGCERAWTLRSGTVVVGPSYESCERAVDTAARRAGFTRDSRDLVGTFAPSLGAHLARLLAPLLATMLASNALLVWAMIYTSRHRSFPEEAPRPAPEARLARLERNGRSLDAWRAALAALLRGGEGFRDASVTRDDLVGLLDDVDAPVERRIAAAIALVEGDDADALELVERAERDADDRALRHAFESVRRRTLDEPTLARAIERDNA